MKIDLSTAVGLVAGIIIISIGIVGNSGELYWFVNGISLLVVLGGDFISNSGKLFYEKFTWSLSSIKKCFYT